jgi:D-alanyl-lipoteichoic acid acyltransferase DltB (MBOAT superfamily)
MDTALLFLEIFVYLVASRLILRRMRGISREIAFAVVNLGGFCLILERGNGSLFRFVLWLYIAVVLLLFFSMQTFSRSAGAKPWLAFFAPILILMFLRYVPTSFYAQFRESLRLKLLVNPDLYVGSILFGFSYLAFRCSHLVLEVRNGIVQKPDFWQYLGFCFFVPTMAVGPINAYSNYRRGFDPDPPVFSVSRSLLRILVGLVKYLFLGNIFNQLSYSGLLLDDHYHPWIDLPVAAICYYIYLYCNFSGFCDVAIGGAGLIGIPVTENFNNPFYARNMKELWNRWHITLSQYMRDVCFSPLSKYFAALFGSANINHAIAAAVMVVFLLIGLWHGASWNYIVFGFLQGLGVIIAHYYTLGLKRGLGRKRFIAYNSNTWIHGAAVIVTFCYFAASTFFFANTPNEIREILSVMKW